MVLETRRGRVAERKKENAHGNYEHFAALSREQDCHTERIENGHGTLERRDDHEPDRDEQGRVRQHVLDDNAGGEDGQLVNFDDIRDELDEQEETIGHGERGDEQRRVRVAHAFAAHDHDAEQIARESEYEQQQQANVPEIP